MAQNEPVEDWMYAYIAAAIDFSSGIIVNIKSADGYKLGYNISPVIKLTTKSKTVTGMIDMVCEQHGISPNIYTTGSDTYDIKITTNEDVEKMLKEIEPYLISSNEQCQLLLRNVIPALNEKQHTNKRGFINIMKGVDEIRKTKSAKYTADYFKDEWDMN